MVAREIRVYGIVQGVGFRPTVSRHAMESGITGSVCNKGPYVEIMAQGTQDQVESFLTAIRERPPKRAEILKLDVRDAVPSEDVTDFRIIESEKTSGEIYISPDIAICEDCKRELFDKGNRRYLHPFINCTCCGPRMTILDSLPYDRERTSMKVFPMCPECASEYYDPDTRRYDAQPVCCNDCGPQVYLLDRAEQGRAAVTESRRILSQGGIIAVKGIGGFHLCCDATSTEAVELLRTRKRRPAKPFAVMARDLETAKRECDITQEAETILTGHQKPILLLEKKPTGKICEAAAPENPKVGIMLPYAPLQMLLFSYDDGLSMPDCLVMTSANESGAPICRDDEEARRELGPLCDAILSHNRMIRIRADDTVMELFRGKPYMIRRSRGYAPLPVLLSQEWSGEVLAVGGELKNTFCLGSRNMFYLSPYVGDLEDLRTVDALQETANRFQSLLELHPQQVACDLQPGYNSTQVAHNMGHPVTAIQHHYAHVLSCMAENDCPGPVLGVSLDGTGYGTDGTIWGGELLSADYRGFERLGHIVPFRQTGGNLSAKEGWRIAVSLLHGLFPGQAAKMAEALGLCRAREAEVILAMGRQGVNTILSTSAGRLFDAVSALLGIRRVSTFEGEAAVQLQFAAQRVQTAPDVFLPAEDRIRRTDHNLILGTDRLVEKILKLLRAGENPELLAYGFHLGLAECITAACLCAREQTGIETAALTGGCYQNTLLLGLTIDHLEAEGFRVLTHNMVPPNDGGIALGQAVCLMAKQQHQERSGKERCDDGAELSVCGKSEYTG